VLVLAPHPDDETLGCGGAIALHLRAGDAVTVAIVTDGGGSRAGGLGRERIVELRREESREAVGRLGRATLVQLGLPEGEWQHEELVGWLSALLAEVQPHVVYCTSCVDFHPEHIRVAQAFASALDVSGGLSCDRVRAYEVQVPLTPVLANLAAPIGVVAHLKAQALRAYTTQLPALSWSPRLARYNGRLYGYRGPAELFWEMSPSAYTALLASHTGTTAYRGLRPRPFTDGLAWLVGLSHRRTLSALRDE
jgi:LmbE family N-acetylglucosaminyl deacetylase